MLISSVTLFPQANATPLFGSSINLSTDGSSASVVTLGTHVYAIWEDTNSDVYVRVSLNGGSTFPNATGTNLNSLSGGVAIQSSNIAASGTRVYVVWEDAGDIKISRNTTRTSFSTPTTLGTGTSPKIAASGNNVYVVWENNNDIRGITSSNSGSTFSSEVNISSNSGISTAAKISADGATAYVVWRDVATGAGDIYFKSLSSAGTNSTTFNLSDNAGNSLNPQINATGGVGYVVWQDQTSPASATNADILFSAVSSTGTISVDRTNLSSNSGNSVNPSISVYGNDVYVAWQDSITSGAANIEILFRHSSNNGAAFAAKVNLSNTNAVSSFPAIVALGNDVNVAWQDLAPGNADILFRSSPNKGDTFGGLLNLSGDSATSTSPDIDMSSTRVSVVWDDTTNTDVFVRSGSISTRDVKFDATQYDSNAATITVRNSTTTADFVTAVIRSTTNATSITLQLNETSANDGNFTGQIALTTGASSTGTCLSGCHLQAAAGAALNATYLGQTANAFMPTKTLSFGFGTYTLTDGGLYPGITITPVIVTLDDSSSNTNTSVRESVDVTVTSTSQPSGITLSLKETGVNTGIFRNSKLIFTTGTAQYSVGDALTITVDRTGESGTFTTASATIASTTSPLTTSSSRAFVLNLTQTGTGTEIFTGILNLAAATNTATNTIGVSTGDILSMTNSASETTNALIIPNSNSTIGAIQAAAGDTITATSSSTTATATISSGAGSGGGGGGVVRPTVIVNVVAGVSTLLGSSSSVSAPLIGSASLVFLGDPAQGLAGTIGKTDLNSLSSTKTAKTGEKLSFQLDINNDAGIDYLTHVELGVNNKGLASVASDTSIIYDKFKSPQITIIDPHKLFADAQFVILKKDPRNGMLKFEVTFAKPMDTSDVRLLAWDINRNFVQKYYEDAIKIEKSDKTSLVQTKTQDKIDTNQIQQKIKPQKILQKENQKDPMDKKTQKTEFDKLAKNTVDKKKTKNELVKKLQDKSFKTNVKTK